MRARDRHLTDTEALDRLCQLCGIESKYTDIWGKPHRVSTQTKRALLAAMGMSVDSPAALRDALSEGGARGWRRMLAPVLVARHSKPPISLMITLPRERATDPLRWVLTPETGDPVEGKIHLAELEPVKQVVIDGVPFARYAFPLPVHPDLGYHQVALERADGTVPEDGKLSLIVVPDACYRPAVLENDGRVWGLALQLYAMRSRRNWGIGDFTDLASLIDNCTALGVDIIGVNPLHALFPHNPLHASPYSPSSRLFLNVLYLDVEAIADFSESQTAQTIVASPEFQRQLHALRAAEQVDYAGVSTIKLAALEKLYEHFRERHLSPKTERGKAFRTFQTEGGDALRLHSLFEALQEHFHRIDPTIWGWPAWPAPYRDPRAAAVLAFASANEPRVEFFEYLQWQADCQLAAAGKSALRNKLGVGLYQDLAVSIDRGGGESWANQKLYAVGASIGAPPDDFNLHGQNWGLPPLIPDALVERAYTPFVATLRANMRHAGALRIDHVMGLMRLFWIPPGMTADDGAYVHYPFTDLLGILALESQRNRCVVIGEDLGTVPDEVRVALKPMNVLSYRLFYFEKDERGDFRPPAQYARQALVSMTTHDLPTLASFWAGHDLKQRTTLNLFPSDKLRDQQILGRAEDRARLLIALDHERLLPEGVTVDPASSPEMSWALTRALHVFLAHTPAQVMMVQLEDLLGQLEQVNLPGTTDERPNWRYKLGLDLEDLLKDERLRELSDALREERGQVRALEIARLAETLIPRASYRLQFSSDFTFTMAKEILPYLDRLGISHCYCSPYLKARAGSHHGYDIVDHNALNPEIGGVEDYDRFVRTLQQHGMNQILDIVPNHMGVGGDDNAWWLDVLENGPASAYADFFDIDWRPAKEELRGKVLLPVLGGHYGQVLENGELRLIYDTALGSLSVHYYDHRFPIDPKTYPRILGHDLERLEQRLSRDDARLTQYQSIITAFRNLPGRDVTATESRDVRHRDKEVHKSHLAELCGQCVELQQFIEETLATFNGTTGDPKSFNLLHTLLDEQAYRPAYWRVAAHEINYRRFFDINDLAGLRMENPNAFAATHKLIIDIVVRGNVTGLRIDHPDGLYDPAQYYARLQESVAEAANSRSIENDHAVGEGKTPVVTRRPYMLAEKILASYEHLPEDWPIHGTTGYEFVNLVNGLFVYGPSEREMDRLYRRYIGRTLDFDELLYDRKKLVMKITLSSELNVLANQLNNISESDRHTRDFTLTALRDALMEVVACFPVYRTYVTRERVTAEDRRYVEWAIALAKKRSPAADVSVFDFIRDILLLNELEIRTKDNQRTVLEFAMRFQQYTAPVMAKGLEDTSFYIYNRLVSLNEVGGDPRRFGVSVSAFHHANQERVRRWPHAMLCTSTHDTKRSEDVRARINVLSEMPREWRQHVGRWSRVNRAKKRKLNGDWAPGRNDEDLLYQTLIGAWPLQEMNEERLQAFRERIAAYMLKAVKEAKIHTSWINPNEEYEDAVVRFVHNVLATPGKNLFLADFVPFQRRISWLGMFNSLSQSLLKLVSPGVPDIYQGNEIWDFSLVDPDNRRQIDYAHRNVLLQDLVVFTAVTDNELAPRVRSLLDSMEDGRAKLYLTWKTLSLRKTHQQIIEASGYQPLEVRGTRAEQLCVFARTHERWAATVVAPRWFSQLTSDNGLPLGNSVWAETWLQAPFDETDVRYTNVLTGEVLEGRDIAGTTYLAVPEVLANFPVALLVTS